MTCGPPHGAAYFPASCFPAWVPLVLRRAGPGCKGQVLVPPVPLFATADAQKKYASKISWLSLVISLHKWNSVHKKTVLRRVGLNTSKQLKIHLTQRNSLILNNNSP
jgi:hypothetical protein